MSCENNDQDVPGYVRPFHRHPEHDERHVEGHAHPNGGLPHHHHGVGERCEMTEDERLAAARAEAKRLAKLRHPHNPRRFN